MSSMHSAKNWPPSRGLRTTLHDYKYLIGSRSILVFVSCDRLFRVPVCGGKPSVTGEQSAMHSFGSSGVKSPFCICYEYSMMTLPEFPGSPVLASLLAGHLLRARIPCRADPGKGQAAVPSRDFDFCRTEVRHAELDPHGRGGPQRLGEARSCRPWHAVLQRVTEWVGDGGGLSLVGRGTRGRQLIQAWAFFICLHHSASSAGASLCSGDASLQHFGSTQPQHEFGEPGPGPWAQVHATLWKAWKAW